MRKIKDKSRRVILKIESYEGEQSFINCGNASQDFAYAVVAIDADGTADIVDCGYSSKAEVLKYWPEARPTSKRSRKIAGDV